MDYWIYKKFKNLIFGRFSEIDFARFFLTFGDDARKYNLKYKSEFRSYQSGEFGMNDPPCFQRPAISEIWWAAQGATKAAESSTDLLIIRTPLDLE